MTAKRKHHIAIIWDFDETLSINDSTTEVVKALQGTGDGGDFWKVIHSLRDKDKTKADWHHVLASDAPIWMYSLSRLAFQHKVPLNGEFFKQFVLPNVKLHTNVIPFLGKLKELSKKQEFVDCNLDIHHFIVSAGLKELVEQAFPSDLITSAFGCRYTVAADPSHKDEPESIPVFCMDETMKTRSIFEIVKGSFDDPDKGVNIRVEAENLWSPFKNVIYVGDGFSDVPALSLVRDRGGIGIAVYDPEWSAEKVRKKHEKLRLDKRADFITAAEYSFAGDLYKYIEARCIQICQRYEAAQSLK